MSGRPDLSGQHLLIAQVCLAGGAFGTRDQVRAVLAFEENLIQGCEQEGVGDFEGNEFGAGAYEARIFCSHPLDVVRVAVRALERTGLTDLGEVFLEDVQTGRRTSLWSGKQPGSVQ